MPKQDPTTSGNPYVMAFHDLMATSKDFAKFLSDPAERQGIRQGFTDAVNRGAIATTLGAPVDMANTALNLGKAAVGYLGNKAGVLSADQMPQLIDNPIGGSEYIGNQMQRFGMVSPNRNALAEGLAGILPMSPSTSGKAVAAIAGGGLVPGMDLAATVFHGSPHKFDRFDSSKIGTGEGAQAYGHGLYLAESPEVAQSYQQTLSHKGHAAIIQNDRNNYSVVAPDGSKIADGVLLGQAHKAKAGFDAGETGSLYKVDLPDEHINKMLDWDKPLSQQVPEVQAAVEKLAGIRVDKSELSAFDNALMAALGDGPTSLPKEPVNPMGSSIYRKLHEKAILSGKAKTAAEKEREMVELLRQQGIPGIRYLDGGSRSAGAGTSNYVVFPGNENMLRILERNGQALK